MTRSKSSKVWVEDDTGSRPFMRGIMVHSLQSRGVPFEEAYRAATEVRDRIRDRATVSSADLAEILSEVIDPSVVAEAPLPSAERTIQVTGGGSEAPFSKGFLSQSLLASAVEPSQAFDVARQLENQLVLEGRSHVGRSELRRLTYEMLRREVGERAAERYLVWRQVQAQDRPVILLLGGAAGAGKTSLAQEVAHRLGITGVVSTDSIRQIMRIMLSPELVPAIHASSYDAWQAMPETVTGEEPVLEGFQTMAQTVTVGARAMMDRAIAENTSLILDGVSLVPGGLDLAPYRNRAHVIFLLVATLDEKAFRSRFAARGAASKERPTHRYLENLDAILRIQDHLLDLAEQHDVPIVDNESLDRSVLSVLRHVTETLRKETGFEAEAALAEL